MAKSILFLGGSNYLIPLITSLKEKNFHIITCDYLPSNEAHEFSDEYWNISILDVEKILEKANKYKIILVSSFACDPGVISAAYISKKLGLPSPPITSVEILQDKNKFRNYLSSMNFHTPIHFSGNQDVINSKLKFPFIIKPTDSAGSKGVQIVNNLSQFHKAKNEAINYSIKGNYIIEELITSEWDPIDTDFVINKGKLIHLNNLNGQLFDSTSSGPLTPIGFYWPCQWPAEAVKDLYRQLELLLKSLNIENCLLNVEARLAKDGKVYLMEVSPRGGGNNLSYVSDVNSDFKVLKNYEKILNGECLNLKSSLPSKYLLYLVIYSKSSGSYKDISLNDNYKNKLLELKVNINIGEKIEMISGANTTFGFLLLNFNSKIELMKAIENSNSIYSIDLI
jgi:biotin carboxylase